MSCPHSVFMRFVWVSEQTAIISLHNINWLVFITERECVYCAVRTGYLNVFVFKRLMLESNMATRRHTPHCAAVSMRQVRLLLC